MVTIIFVYVSICGSKFSIRVTQVENHATQDATDVANDLPKINAFVSKQRYRGGGQNLAVFSLLRYCSHIFSGEGVHLF
jgi:hypothetical protein